MKLKSTLALHAQGEMVRRDPGMWDKFKKLFGAKPNLETDRVRTNLTTALLVHGVKKALERLGVNNAVALVIDGQVLFEDRKGSADDLGDLYLAFYENESLYGRDFKDLRLTVEHREAGLHYVIEIAGKGEHQLDEATAQVIVAARISDFEVRPGEDAEAFRQRVQPLLATPAFTETHRLQFESFVERVREGIRDALPEVQVRSSEARAAVERPERPGRGKATGGVTDPRDPRYDPYEHHVPSVAPGLAAMVFWSSMLSWSWHPHYLVVDQRGAEVGTTEDLGSEGANGYDDEPGDGGGMDGADESGDGGDGDWGDGGFDAGGDGDW